MDSLPTPGSSGRELELLRRMARIAGLGGWDYDPQARTLYWTEQVFRIVELEPYSVTPTLESAVGFYAPEARATIARALHSALEHGEAWDLELPLVTARGRRIWVRTIGEPEIADGRCVRLAGTIEDVTAARRAREALKARSADNRRLALVAEHTSNLVLITGPDDRIQWVNASFTRVTGYAYAEAIGRTPFELLLRSETAADPQLAAVRESMQRGEPVRDLHVELTRKDGSRYWAEIEIRPVFDERGAVANYIHIHNDVSERRRAAAQMQEAIERLRLVEQTMGFGMLLRDLPNGRTLLDAQALRLHGFPEAAAAPSSDELLARIHPDDRARFRAVCEGLLQAHGVQDDEYRVVHDAGRIAYLHARSFVERAADGAPLRVIGIVFDVTDKRQAEQQQRLLSERLALASRTAGIGVWEADLDGQAVTWDDQMRRLYGLAHEQPAPCITDWIEQWVHPDDRARVVTGLIGFMRRGGSYQDEHRIVLRDGTERWIEARAFLYRPDPERPGRVIGVNFDITERKLAELRAAEAARQLREALARLELATTGSGIGIFERTLDRQGVYWSPQMFRLYGEPPRDTAPDWDWLLERIDPEDRALFESQWERIKQSPTYVDTEFRIRRRDGSRAWLLTRARLQPAEGERPARVVGICIDITQRKEAESRAAQYAQRLRLAAEAGGIASWERDLETGEARWDEAMFDLFGLPRAPAAPALDVVLSRVHPDDRAAFADAWKRMATSGDAVEWEVRIVRPDGRIVHLVSRGRAERRVDGTPWRVIGVSLDATESRRTAQQLKDALARLRLATEISAIGIWERDPDGKGRWDPMMFRLFGLPPGEAPTLEQAVAMVHPEDRAGVLAGWQRMREVDHAVELEYRVIRPDGAIVYLNSRGRAERGADGRVLRFVGAMIDVTEVRRVQQERDALSDRLRLATASVGMGVWVWDLATRTSVWDDAMYALFGTTRESFRDRIWLDAVHPDDRARAARAVQDALDGLAALDTEFRVIWPDGTVRHLASRGSVERNAHGEVVRMVGVNWDVTERHTAQAALLAKEAAERASRAKTEFLSRMSHELRTPLNAIIGFAQVLALDRTYTLAPLQRDRLDQIEKAGWHLLTLINEILDLSRIEAGALQLSMETVALAELVGECIALISADAQRRALSIGQTQTARAPANVWTDRTRLKQVLLNLLTNAVKYNREGGRIDVDLDADAEGRALITVRDTGPGLAPEQIARIFEPFDRLGVESSSIEGTGIGLTIALRLVEQMGGRLTVTSKPGVGSAFHVALQAASPARDEAAGALQAIAPASVEPREDVRGTVLYVEDNPSNVALVEQLLALRPNVKLFTASDGASGRVMAAVCQPDLILLDMRLPDTDGLSLLAELRARPETKSIPCIALSANAMPADIAQARAAGFADYWTKPIEADPFLRGIDAALARRA